MTRAKKTKARKEKEVVKEEVQFDIKVNPITQCQKELMYQILRNDIVFVTGQAGTGKAQPLDSIVYTTSGPKLMKDIKIGDKTCLPNGKFTTVIGVFPQGNRHIYRFTFDNGETVESCEDHLWKIDNSHGSKKTKILTTKEMYLEFLRRKKNKFGKIYYGIDAVQPVYFDEQTTDLDPYLLGILIGDGCLKRSIRFSSNDDFIISKVSEIIDKYQCIIKKIKPYNKNSYDYSITRNKNCKINNILELCKKLDLYNKYSYEKFIPKNYLYNSIENRIKLLQGLMDTDGSISNNKLIGNRTVETCVIEYTTTSKQLSKDVKELVESLGGKCRIVSRYTQYTYKDCKKNGRLSYRCYIKFNNLNPFLLPRKRDRFIPPTKYKCTRYIQKIDYVGTKEAKCIKVADSSELYITNNFITTHNTHISLGMATQALFRREINKIIITRPAVYEGKGLGYLPGDISDKMAPFLIPIYDELKRYIPVDRLANMVGMSNYNEDPQIEIVPLEYMRGRTFRNCFTGDTLITLSNGKVKYIKDIIIGDKVLSFDKNTGFVENKVIATQSKIPDKIIEIKTTKDPAFRCTPEHKLFAIKDNKYGYIEASNLNPGDCLLINKKHINIENNEEITPEEAAFVGVVLCDGHITRNKNTIAIQINDRDEDYMRNLIASYLDTIRNEFNLNLTETRLSGRNAINFRINNKKFIEYLMNKYNIPCGKKSNKIQLPKIITDSNNQVKKSFISACFDSEGSVSISSKISINFSSNSKIFILELMNLLNIFDIKSAFLLRKRKNPKHGDQYILNMGGPSATKFLREIGFKLDRKQQKGLNGPTYKQHNPTNPIAMIADENEIYNINKTLGYSIDKKSKIFNETYNKIKHLISQEKQNICDNFDIVQIKSIKDCNVIEPVYDFEVENTHNFIANRILSSNCYILVDESQNCTAIQLKTILTRIGHGSKVIINGDLNQSDLPLDKQGGLKTIISKLSSIDRISHVDMKTIVRHDIIDKIIKALDTV